jgi:hypothetical protein
MELLIIVDLCPESKLYVPLAIYRG